MCLQVAELPIDAAPKHRVTLSAGIRQYVPGESPRAANGRADEALDPAKAAGRNRYAPATTADGRSRGEGAADSGLSSVDR